MPVLLGGRPVEVWWLLAWLVRVWAWRLDGTPRIRISVAYRSSVLDSAPHQEEWLQSPWWRFDPLFFFSRLDRLFSSILSLPLAFSSFSFLSSSLLNPSLGSSPLLFSLFPRATPA
ncbi:hypothetical protein C8J57DRAFT_1305790, partial [Mycena rebaudengoi]